MEAEKENGRGVEERWKRVKNVKGKGEIVDVKVRKEEKRENKLKKI